MKFHVLTVRAFAAVLLTISAALTTAQAASRPPHVPPSLIVGLVKQQGQTAEQLGQSAAALISTASGVQVSFRRQLATGGFLFQLPLGTLPVVQGLVEGAFRALPGVSFVEEDPWFSARFTPNDTRYNEQWHYFESTGGIRLPTAWDVVKGFGVKVAVLDTGYLAHPDLAANLVGGYDFISNSTTANDGDGRDSSALDPGDAVAAAFCGASAPARNSSWHGTHVAGTIAAVGDNASGVAGVAFRSKVVPVRVLGRCGGSGSDIADGIIWASGGSVPGVPANAHPAKVLNLSLGGSGTCGTTTQAAINSARSRGTVVVIAAGNDNVDVTNTQPANCSGVITVAATNRAGGKASYSNFGSLVDVAAPGGQTNIAGNGVLSTLNTGTAGPVADSFAFYQGTSMATPHVAGVAALMIAKTASLTPDQIETTLKQTARVFPATCTGCGAGIIDATAALGGAAPPPMQKFTDTIPGQAGAQNSQAFFSHTLPAGAQSLLIETSGGTGDADLYVRFGAAPTTSTYDCRPFLVGNNEQCGVDAPSAGTYHGMLRGFEAYSGVTLTISYWVPSAADTTPDPFTFPIKKNVAKKTTVTSQAVTITGLTAAAQVSVMNGMYSIGCNPNGFTANNGNISNNQTICVRHTSAGKASTQKKTTLTIGGVVGYFRSRTAAGGTSAAAADAADDDEAGVDTEG